jgi:hypothetical protein
MTGINADDDYDNPTFFSRLFLFIIIAVEINPAIKSPVSSFMPSETAALNPMIDQAAGMIMTIKRVLDLESNKIPKVKIVVGQGNPNVSDAG